MKNSRTKDMTTGSPIRHILLFALPLLAGNLFQQLYSMVDSIIVGNFVSADALAAVGSCGSLNFLFFSLCSGLSIGIGVIVAQCFGAGDEDRIRRTIASAVYVLTVSSAVVSLIGICFAPFILDFLDVPEKILPDAITYLRTTCSGILGVALYNGVTSILRALGDSKTPLYFLILSSIMNLLLDLLFVLVFHWGVFGAGFATILSQYMSAMVSIRYARTHVSYFQMPKEDWKPNKKIILQSVRLGVPIAFQNSLIAISCVALQNIVNQFGATVMAAYTITGRIEQMIQQPYSSLSMAITSYTGQNIGAGHLDRVKKGFRWSILIILLFSLTMLPLAYLFGRNIASLFVNETAVIEMGAAALRITSVCYFFLGLIYVPRALLNGAGDTGFSMINGFTEVSCRILFSRILTRIPSLGFWGIWITTGVTWFITGIVCLIRYASGVWKRKRLT